MASTNMDDAVRTPVDNRSPAEQDALVQACFDRCCDSFFRYFSVRLRDDHLVDDLMQQLWLRSRIAAGDLEGDNAEPWMWSIARNLLRETFRRADSKDVSLAFPDPQLAATLAERMDQEDLPDQLLSRREVHDQLLLAVTSLPSEVQDLLIGFYFEGRTHAELAQIHGVSERAVEGRMYRARLALRERLAHLEG